MGKILVKAPQIQLGPNGPQMFYNVGVGGGGRGGSGARGRTKRSRVGGALGGAVGVLGGLAGESRSLGGLLSNVQVGAMQGSAVGRGLAGLGTSRRRQARADLEEQAKDDYAKQRASLDFQERQSNPSFASRMNPMNINRRRFEAEQERMQQANRGALTPEEFGRHLAQRRDDSARLARDNTNAQNREMGLAEHKATEAAYNMAQTVDPHQLAQAQQLIAGNLQGPTLGQQMPATPVQPAAGFNQSDKTVNEELNTEGNRDNQSNSVERSQAEIAEEQTGQQGQQGQKSPEEFERRQGAFEGMGQFMQEGQQ
tara:strand:- start:117 stop:1052 length:936 start_codon:yes stop_codon:yes gene_type:complete